MVDISKIKPGDMVVLKPVTVTAVGFRECGDLFARVGGRGVELKEHEISEHIPAPSEFKVGDRVKVDCSFTQGGWEAEVRAIDGDFMMLRSNRFSPQVVEKKHCSHID